MSIFKTPTAKNRLKRNAFDLSERHLFTGSIGELLPCFVKECVPGDKFVIKPSVFLRTMPMQTASFVRVKQTIEFFKVPIRLLWSKFPQYFSNTKFDTSTYFSTGSIGLPLFTLYKELPPSDFNTSRSLQDFLASCDRTKPQCKNIFGVDSIPSTCKLLDLLGYGLFDPTSQTLPAHTSKMMVSPFRLLAYQKIYQDFYRNPLYENLDAKSFNIDRLDKSMPSPFDIFSDYQLGFYDEYDRIFKLRFRNLKSDYFTNLRPTFAGANWIGNSFSGIHLPSPSSDSQFNVTDYNEQSIMSAATPASGSAIQFSINNLRSAYALDKLLDSVSRAKDGCYVHQIESRFGIKPHVDDFHSVFLGGCDAPVQISEVVSTVNTSSEPLGTIGGKALSFNTGSISVECDEHCIIMGIMSFVPETDYPSLGVDREVQKKYREEFFNPEFMDLGYQPTTYSELFATLDTKSSSTTHDDSFVLGWNPRYSEYKTGIDKVHGDFNRDGTFRSWCAPYTSWVAKGNFMSIESLKINPSLFDTIFYVNYNGSSKTDHFLINSSLDVKAIRPMSISGLPHAD